MPSRTAAFLQDEVDTAWLYRRLAEMETDQQLADVYSRLAATEETHARQWEERLGADGRSSPHRPGWRVRTLAALARRFGPQLVLPTLVAWERSGAQAYAGRGPDADGALAAQEQSHARVLQALSGSTGVAGGTIARLEGRHRAVGGNALRAAVLGANDGLVSNLSLVMGVAGAALPGSTILITGLAGLLAGAGSMAMGEWLSVQSSRELYQRQIDIEAKELAAAPEEEAEELALIYQAKGLSPDEARSLARRITTDERTAIDTLAREELGIDPLELGGSAWEAAGTSFVLFAIGAVIPVVPFALLTGSSAIVLSLLLSAVALFALGAGITLLTGRGLFFSGMRQLLIGIGAAALTFGVGRLIGVSLGG